jgi:hypothetical protein
MRQRHSTTWCPRTPWNPMMRTSCRCERGRGAGGPGLDKLRNKTRFYRAKIGFYWLKPKTPFCNGKKSGFFQPCQKWTRCGKGQLSASLGKTTHHWLVVCHCGRLWKIAESAGLVLYKTPQTCAPASFQRVFVHLRRGQLLQTAKCCLHFTTFLKRPGPFSSTSVPPFCPECSPPGASPYTKLSLLAHQLPSLSTYLFSPLNP